MCLVQFTHLQLVIKQLLNDISDLSFVPRMILKALFAYLCVISDLVTSRSAHCSFFLSFLSVPWVLSEIFDLYLQNEFICNVVEECFVFDRIIHSSLYTRPFHIRGWDTFDHSSENGIFTFEKRQEMSYLKQAWTRGLSYQAPSITNRVIPRVRHLCCFRQKHSLKIIISFCFLCKRCLNYQSKLH